MGLMSASGGLTLGKLKLANAQESDVSSGKTFYSGDKLIKTGTLVERGQYQYAGGIGGGSDYIALNRIPEGIYRANGAPDWAPEIRVKMTDLSKYMINGIQRIAKASIGDFEGLTLNTTISDNKYKCLLMFIGDRSAGTPTVNISNALWTKFEDLYFDGYSGGEHYTTGVGWLYFIYKLNFPVTINVSYTGHYFYGNRNCTVWGIY